MRLHYLNELRACTLCEWRCNVNRLNGERGVCRVGIPEIAYTSFAYVLKSYSITFLGCCFRCIYCNAYRISQYPDAGWRYRGYSEPEEVADEVHTALGTPLAQEIGIHRLSFTGGEPSLHTPYLEAVVGRTREVVPGIEVGIATNGFSTHHTLKRLMAIASYFNFEIKAFDDAVHEALTGAPVEPVLRNAEFIAAKNPEKIRVLRTVVVPGITDTQVPQIAEFIKDIDPVIPYRLIGFRPSFILYYHPGPSKRTMQRLVKTCRDIGLKNVDFSGYYPANTAVKSKHRRADAAQVAAMYLRLAGCPTNPRNCGKCTLKDGCKATLMEPWLVK
jgi:pyruvate formate lyase activating enzyme